MTLYAQQFLELKDQVKHGVLEGKRQIMISEIWELLLGQDQNLSGIPKAQQSIQIYMVKQ